MTEYTIVSFGGAGAEVFLPRPPLLSFVRFLNLLIQPFHPTVLSIHDKNKVIKGK
jgi:hypothetical protein